MEKKLSPEELKLNMIKEKDLIIKELKDKLDK